MSRKLITAILLVGLPCLILLLRLSSRLIQAALFSAGTPQCPKCGRHNMRSSRRSGVLDGLLALLRCRPYRCRVCAGRFYRFGDILPASMEPGSAPTKPTGFAEETGEGVSPPSHRGIRIKLRATEAEKGRWIRLLKVTVLLAVAGVIAAVVLAATAYFRNLHLPASSHARATTGQ